MIYVFVIFRNGYYIIFSVAIVNLVDGVTVPKSYYMTEQLAR